MLCGMGFPHVNITHFCVITHTAEKLLSIIISLFDCMIMAGRHLLERLIVINVIGLFIAPAKAMRSIAADACAGIGRQMEDAATIMNLMFRREAQTGEHMHIFRRLMLSQDFGQMLFSMLDRILFP